VTDATPQATDATPAATDGATARSYGRVFDTVAAEYDRNRPAYPDELVAHAVALAGLRPGDPVLEIGCGTGQLTGSLLRHGLKVTAVEPGANLVALAAQNLAGQGDVEFINAGLEDAELPRDDFRAAFAASSFHWPDPDTSWRLVADALGPAGVFALMQYTGLDDESTAADLAAMMEIFRAHAPALAAEWPAYRDIDATIAGVARRRGNLSEVWAWLGSYDLARDYAAALFDDAEIAAIPVELEQTAQQIVALLGTMSYWARLSPEQQQAISSATEALHVRLGRPIRSSTLATLVTARRTGDS